MLRKQELISQGYVRMESPYMLTSKGEEILPEDLKIKIREIVRSKKFRKIAKKDSIEDVVPLILDKVGIDRLGEVATKAEMNTANIAIVASLYALNQFKEKGEVRTKRKKDWKGFRGKFFYPFLLFIVVEWEVTMPDGEEYKELRRKIEEIENEI